MTFVVADVTGPIVGTVFISFYYLLGDIQHGLIFDNITKVNLNGASV
jgi:hypothetical protein